jgi:hypothetical protein
MERPVGTYNIYFYLIEHVLCIDNIPVLPLLYAMAKLPASIIGDFAKTPVYLSLPFRGFFIKWGLGRLFSRAIICMAGL